jgi:predicted RNA-binding protein with PUA-like domain
MKGKNFWLVKQEPDSYSWDDFVRDGETAWTGVRNFQARNNLRAMKKGDLVFYYHSNIGKEIVGIAKVSKEHYPDKTAGEGDWSAVDLTPLKPLKVPVTLDQIKTEPALKEMALVKNSRLSVQPVTPEEAARVLELAATKI